MSVSTFTFTAKLYFYLIFLGALLDENDKKILRIVQSNAKTSRSHIAEAIGLSTPSVSERLNKLEERGLIKGYEAIVDRKALGFDILVFIIVISDTSKRFPQFVERAVEHPNILECHAVMGEGSHILKAVARNTANLEKLLGEIQSWPGVLSTQSSFALSTAKETTKFPIT
ncbi:MAG: winged helix-turn-helix transcriptional regulator [Ignavibacteriales bacterium]|nr:winged helix-turn-helix transcriptional regulator [Ignavibacteriales bacterium]